MGLMGFNRMRMRRNEEMTPEKIEEKQKEKAPKGISDEPMATEEIVAQEPTITEDTKPIEDVEVKETKRGSKRK